MSWIESPPRWLARLAMLAAGIGLVLAFSSGARAVTNVPVDIVIGGHGSVVGFAGGPFDLYDTTLDCHRLGSTQTGVCEESVPTGSHVGLQAIPAPGYTFTGWSVLGEEHSHGCGQEVYCIAHLGDNPVTFYAQFDPVSNVFLTVLKLGSAAAQGVVSSVPAGILCGLDCTDAYPSTSTVTLTATAPSGVTFAGWGGDCAAFGTNSTCVLTMGVGRAVTATFNAATFPLSVTVVGQGTVSSLTDAGIACPSVCAHAYPSNSQVVLHDDATPGWEFTGWSGAGCTGTVPCTLTMFQAQAVTATFARSTVDAHVVRTSFRYTALDLRQLRVQVDPDEVVTVTLTLRRGGSILQQKRLRNVQPAPLRRLDMTLGQGIASGRATLQVLFTNTAGTEKLEVRRVTVPPARSLV